MSDQSGNDKLLGEQFLTYLIDDSTYLHNLLRIESKEFKFSFIESEANYN